MSIQDWASKDKTFLREWLLNLLKTQIITVKFFKKDQTTRVMKCTLKDDIVRLVPYEQKTDRVKPVNEEIIAVWDVENNGWRSFNINSIIGVGSEL